LKFLMQCPDCFSFAEVEEPVTAEEANPDEGSHCVCGEAMVIVDLRRKMIEDLKRDLA